MWKCFNKRRNKTELRRADGAGQALEVAGLGLHLTPASWGKSLNPFETRLAVTAIIPPKVTFPEVFPG